VLKVSVEKKTAAGGSDFSIVESTYSSPSTSPDNVLITTRGVDFGGWEFSDPFNDPMGSGTLYWNRGDGADITPRLMGSYWLNHSAGVCARMNLVYYTESGSYLDQKPGGAKCAPSNDPYGVSVDLSPYTSTKVAQVVVQLQTQGTNGSWNTAGSKTVTIDD